MFSMAVFVDAIESVVNHAKTEISSFGGERASEISFGESKENLMAPTLLCAYRKSIQLVICLLAQSRKLNYF